MSNITVQPAAFPDDVPAVRSIFEEYMKSLGIDLSFQNADAELADIPGKYAAPKGEILIARNAEGEVVGCVALRPLEAEQACEIKRLYLRPSARGLGVAHMMIRMLLASARRIGYASIYLDTLQSMHAAQRLYASFGFTETDAYYATPISETVFMRLTLSD